MANENYIDKIKVGGETYDIRDTKLAPVADELLELGKNGGLQYGHYIYKDLPDRFEFVEEVPEDYSGIAFGFFEDGQYVEHYVEGVLDSGTYISPEGVTRVNPSALVGLTHSFDELDPVLKQIVDDAIAAGGTGVACTPEQWNGIKQLLDNSLYLNYQGIPMIKSYFDGIRRYIFGGVYILNHQLDGAMTLKVFYDSSTNDLFIIYGEI